MSSGDIAVWFGLRRTNYIINPKTDAGFYAPRSGVNVQQIVESLRVNLVTGVPPKRLFWGLYGGGKTHTLFKVARELEPILPVKEVYVECPNVAKKSTFLHLYHDGILASFGQDFMVNLFERLVDDVIRDKGAGRTAILSGLQVEVGDEELARAVAALVGADADRKLLFWKFISGVEVPRSELPTLGQTQDLVTAQPANLAENIVTIGRVVRKIYKQTLLIVLDELDRLQYVGDETGSTFQDAFRKLMDDNQLDVSILMGCSAASLKELPDVFGGAQGPVLSRIGKTNLVEIPQIQTPAINDFIKSIILFVRNREGNVQELIERARKDTAEDLDQDLFPFTREAIEKLKGTLQGIMTPREVTQRMTQAAGKAFLMGKSAVTQDAI
jgi:hypothetical protein